MPIKNDREYRNFNSFELRAAEDAEKTTGGGDNFNSGFCAGLLGGLDIKSCLISGMTTSYLYVKNGKCNSFDDIAETMKMYDAQA